MSHLHRCRPFLSLFLVLAAWCPPALADPLEDGDLAHADGDLATALVQWSLALQETRDAGDAVAEFDLLLRLAAVNRDLGRLAAAGELLGVAEGVAERLDDPNAPGRVLTATSLLALTSGDARRAEDLASRAFELHRSNGDPVGAANAAVDLGLARRARGKTDEAVKAFSAALTLFETLEDRGGQADALVDQGRGLEALVVAERLQQLELGQPRAAGDDDDALRVQQLVDEQAWVGDALAVELAGQLEGEGDSERARTLREQLSQMRVEFAETVDRLRASHPDFDRLVRVDPEDLEAIQGQLDPGVVVLQPVVLPDRIALLVFKRDGLRTITVDVPAEEVERAVGRLARSLRSGDTYDPAWTERQCDALGQWLLAPVAEDLAGADVVAVSKTGVLRQLPFALLRLDGEYPSSDVVNRSR